MPNITNQLQFPSKHTISVAKAIISNCSGVLVDAWTRGYWCYIKGANIDLIGLWRRCRLEFYSFFLWLMRGRFIDPSYSRKCDNQNKQSPMFLELTAVFHSNRRISGQFDTSGVGFLSSVEMPPILQSRPLSPDGATHLSAKRGKN